MSERTKKVIAKHKKFSSTYVCNVRERVKLHLLNNHVWVGRFRDLDTVAVVDEDVILVVGFARHKQHLSQCE